MNRKRWGIPFAAIMTVMAVGTALWGGQGGILILFALPFRYLGLGLRSLSLSGALGNIIAIILFAAVSLLMLLPVVLDIRKKQKAPLEHILCVLAAVLMPFLLYRFVNPQIIKAMFPSIPFVSDTLLIQGELLLSFGFWSVAAAYAVIRSLRVYDGNAAGKGMKAALTVLSLVMIVSVCYIDVHTLIADIRTALGQGAYAANELFAGELIPKTNPGVDVLLAVLRFAGSAVPSLLLLGVFPICFRLLDKIAKDRFAQGNAALALTAAKRARKAITVSVLLGVVVNLIQLLLVKFAANVDLNLDLPLLEILTAFLLLLIADGFRKGFELADENSRFV